MTRPPAPAQRWGVSLAIGCLLLGVSLTARAQTGQTLVLWTPSAAGSSTPAATDPVLKALRAGLPSTRVTPLTDVSPAVRAQLEAGDLRPDQLVATDPQSLAALGMTLEADWVLSCPREIRGESAEALPAPSPKWLLVRTDTARAVTLEAAAPEDLTDRVKAETAEAGSPAPAQALYERGLSWLKRGHGHEALPYLRKATRLTPYALDYRAALGRALRLAGKLQEARDTLSEVLRRQSDHTSALIDMAEIDLARGDVPQAQRNAEKVEQTGVEDPDLDLVLGKIHFAAGRYRRALEYLDLVRDRWEAWRTVALIQSRQKDWSSALTSARRVLRDAPDDLEMRRLAARALRESRRYSEALLERSELLRRMARAGLPVAQIDGETEALLVDTLAAVQSVVAGDGSKGDLYRASQEALVLADYLQTRVSDLARDGDETSGDHRELAYKLWSQAAYDQLKGIESGDLDALEFPADLLREAVVELQAARRSARQVPRSGRGH